ncbi:MAG TPA: ABC transporter ATP-binding protein, partial [Phototrophicaceae bacterium]|nr:ABC transporter ATP-binding protein [Phototrophicaceae bacterium]
MLTLNHITRAFERHPVLRGIDLEIGAGEIDCLLGPSGCGKTTLLRIVAGLETADGGDVLLQGKSILTQPVHTRDFGLMFQDFALFPHLNVLQNVEFGLRMKRIEGKQARAREVLELVGLSGFETRDVAQLSGGERQRVALARSLAPNPRLLMLDEPLGSLDAALRERLVIDLREIIKRVGLTALYVTHDQHEAFAIADRIALMNAGQIEQIGTPEQVYRTPETTFVARFLGLNNVIPVDQLSGREIKSPIGTFEVSLHDDGLPAALLLHPDGITPDANGQISGMIRERVFLGDAYRVVLQTTQD